MASEDVYERVLCVKNEVLVFKIPPRPSNRGYRAADWSLDKHDWSGRLRVVTLANKLFLKLEDKTVLMYSSPMCTTVEKSVATTTYSTPMYRRTDGSTSSLFFGDGSTSQSSTVEDSVATTTYSTQMYRSTDDTTTSVFFGDGSTPQSSTVEDSVATTTYSTQMYRSTDGSSVFFGDGSTDYPHIGLQRLMLRAYKGYSIFIIVVVLLGIVGNLSAFTMIVYRGIARKSSLYFCLACIAFLDLIFNITSGLLEFVVPTLSADEFMPEMYSEYYGYKVELDDSNYVLGKAANVGDIMCGVVTFVSSGAVVASAWINVTIHVTKLIGVLSPFGKLSRNINTITVICCVISLLFGFAVFAPVSADTVLETERIAKKFIDPPNITTNGYYMSLYCSSQQYGLLDFNTHEYISKVMLNAYCIVPGALLSILSLTILGVFMRNYREHKRLMSAQTNQSGRKRHKDNFEIAKNRVLILLPLSLVHIVCTIPVIVIDMNRNSYFASILDGELELDVELEPTAVLDNQNRYFINEFILEHLRDVNHGELFAECPIDEYPSVAIEAVTDSSRYFVIRIKDKGGRSAFIGIGFTDRGDAFDLNVALQDHFKHIKTDAEIEKGKKDEPNQPKLDLGFKEGQTITINIGSKKGEATAKSRPKGSSSGTPGFLPPPPGGVRIKPPPSQSSPVISQASQQTPQQQQPPTQPPQQPPQQPLTTEPLVPLQNSGSPILQPKNANNAFSNQSSGDPSSNFDLLMSLGNDAPTQPMTVQPQKVDQSSAWSDFTSNTQSTTNNTDLLDDWMKF